MNLLIYFRQKGEKKISDKTALERFFKDFEMVGMMWSRVKKRDKTDLGV